MEWKCFVVCLSGCSESKTTRVLLSRSLASKINAWLNRFTHIEQSHSKGDVTARGVERVAMVTGGPDWVGCRRKRSGVRGEICGSECARVRDFLFMLTESSVITALMGCDCAFFH